MGNTSKTYKSKKYNIHMKVTKDTDTNQIVKVEHANGNIKVQKGKIKDLQLSGSSGELLGIIDLISDNSTIDTHASPGCFWYFFSGNWYKICL